ncbi:MAG: alanine--tRNA ligase [Planctomycetota bacterium]|nr:alanine--tRNA ligase [Planctomycetota bacterium]
MLTSRQIRQQYIDFFVQKHGHAFVASSPVVPHEDPTLLFTNAGMNQFKPYFLGTVQPPHRRVANTQKSIRAGGKHNDLDDVGRSRRHHTFFEMLGNWSFGDYFKQGAIEMAWELLTQVWKLDPARLHVTCFEGDEKNGVPRDTEAADIWKKTCGIPDERVHYFGKDNFWEMGDTGPCGPCTEIYVDRRPQAEIDADKKAGRRAPVNADDPRVMEIWNLVFIQYNRDASGKLTILPAQHVDTGMGFERISQVIQGKDDNYGTDLWDPLFAAIAKLSGHQYTGKFPATNAADPVAEAADPQLRTDIAFRVIADHARCLTFALTDGAVPSNEGRGYVLRRILRRAVRFGRQQLGLADPFVHKLVPTIAESMGDIFPELRKNPQRVIDLIKEEEESFGRTLDRGIALFEDAAQSAGKAGGKTVSAEAAFKLHDTFGFPLDLTQVMATERGMAVDVDGFHKLMEQAKELARSGGETGGSAAAVASLIEVVQQAKPPATKFLGYEKTEAKPQTWSLLFRLEGNVYKPIDHAVAGETLAIILGETPFYAESGGQVGDTGAILNAGGGIFRVQDTIKVGDAFFHLGIVEKGPFLTSKPPLVQPFDLRVDAGRRGKIMSNHTTTHLMNKALRALVTATADQKGSLVDDQKLRFDFSHNAAVTAQQIEEVEKAVNADIAADLPVYFDYAPQEQALKIKGLRAVFGEKYPPKVRIVSVGVPVKDLLAEPNRDEWARYSIEFCGGTHMTKTGDAEGFTIISEEAVGKGVRRITAFTGESAHQAAARGGMLEGRLDNLRRSANDIDAQRLAAELADLGKQLGESPLPATARTRLRDGMSELQKVLKERDKQRGKESAGAVVDKARAIADAATGSVLVEAIADADADALRVAMDVIKKKKPEMALLLGGVAGDKVSFVAAVPEAMIKKGLKAGDWVREVAKAAGGGGGGRPDMAQAGGKDPAKLAEALEVGRRFAAGKI